MTARRRGPRAGHLATPDLIRQASRAHTRAVQSRIEFLASSNRPKHFFSIDTCYLKRNYFGLIYRPNFMEWVQNGQVFCNQLSSCYHRVLPLPRRRYAPLEIDMIKYSFHVLLSLGSILYVTFTDDPRYLEKTFGTDNLLVVQNGFSVSTRGVWETGVANFQVDRSTESLDVFQQFLRPSWREENEVIRLKYGINSFHTGVRRAEPIKELYGRLLYLLQSGACALSDPPERLEYDRMQIDHVYPACEGGNNTIINLQAANPEANNSKSSASKASGERIFHDRELEEMGLDCDHPYQALSYRTARRNPLGYLLL